MERIDLRSLTQAEIRETTKTLHQPPYRAGQIFAWVHERDAMAISEMTDLPLALRRRLEENFYLSPVIQAEKQTSPGDGTTKYLFNMEKNTIIECVLMNYSHGNSLCVSTQAGCRMGCRFCASAVGGLSRNLTAGEICGQIYRVRRDTGCRIDTVVLMGCGEPLDNYDNTVRFIALISHPKGIGQRHITVSTCGLVPQIKALANLRLQITLAVSLHAPNDRIRKELMPIAKRFTLSETLEACRQYIDRTNRRITFEYALIRGVNDTASCATTLAGLLKGMLCHVNLIPINATTPFLQPYTKKRYGHREAEDFARVLVQSHIPVTIRRTMGDDIQAACGQLRARHMEL